MTVVGEGPLRTRRQVVRRHDRCALHERQRVIAVVAVDQLAVERAQTRRTTASSSSLSCKRSLTVLTPAQVASPLAARPYDLRHAAVTLWLNGGVPAPEVAARVGHGVEILLRVYAGCIDGDESAVNSRIDQALQGGAGRGPAVGRKSR